MDVSCLFCLFFFVLYVMENKDSFLVKIESKIPRLILL